MNKAVQQWYKKIGTTGGKAGTGESKRRASSFTPERARELAAARKAKKQAQP